MAAARSLLVSVSCAALVLAAVVVPAPIHAQSNGVPPVDGLWSGTFKSTYWDQTSMAAVKPKLKFKSKVAVDIDQDADEITMTITFEDPFPVNRGISVSQLVLEGFAGNYHVSAGLGTEPVVSLSAQSNKKGTSLKLTGVAASSEFTHEIKFSLKRKN